MNWGRGWVLWVGGECAGSCLRRNDGGGVGVTEGAQV